MKASLIWDHKNELSIPVEMGTPAPNQMQGTRKENLCEIAGRVCYDSLGKGRSSADFHKHLVEVKHWSVYEHARFELGFSIDTEDVWKYLYLLIGIPGIEIRHVYNEPDLNEDEFLLCVNGRHILDWNKNAMQLAVDGVPLARVYNSFLAIAQDQAPAIFGSCNEIPDVGNIESWPTSAFKDDLFPYRTLFLRGSRGFSHEMVRHRYSMSQRSTRYVDENESDWIQHPLLAPHLDAIIEQYQDEKTGEDIKIDARYRLKKTESFCKTTYTQLIDMLEPLLLAAGLNKLDARKQARGAARGYLGNALATELVFTAPLAGWHNMLQQRFNPAADKEIYCIFEQVNAIVK